MAVANLQRRARHEVRIIGGAWKRTMLPVLDRPGLEKRSCECCAVVKVIPASPQHQWAGMADPNTPTPSHIAAHVAAAIAFAAAGQAIHVRQRTDSPDLRA